VTSGLYDRTGLKFIAIGLFVGPMYTSRFLVLALLAPVVAGCLTSSPQVSQSNEDRCAARGHKPDSKAFSDCIASFESVRERKMDARRNEMLERSNMPAAASRN
jgi:hypothetical protein